LIKNIWSVFLDKEKHMLMALMVLLFVTSVLELTGLILVIPYVNMMMDSELANQYVNKFPQIEYLFIFDDDYRWKLSVWFGVFYLFKNILLVIFTYIQQGILSKIEANLAQRMFQNYLRQPYSYHLNTQSSDLVRSITYDSLVFVDGILSKGALLITELLLLFGVLLMLALTSPEALVVLATMIIPIILIYVLIRWHLRAWGEILQEREARVIQHLQEGLGGIKDVIILGVLQNFANKFWNNVDNRAVVKRNRGVAIAVPRFVIESMMMITMAAALVWLDQKGGLENHLSSIAFLAIVTVRLLPMSTRVLSSVSSIRTAGPSVDVVYNSLSRKNKKENIRNSVVNKLVVQSKDHSPVTLFEKIEVKNITFNYENCDAVIDGVSFSVKSGEMVGIVGGSGAGKTTLVDLLLGLLSPGVGEISVNGTNINENLAEWQSIIGYVQQTVFLIDATITENVAFGIPSELIDKDRVQKVLELAKLDGWINSLEIGVDTWVGERGVRISGGQRQRIGIARALYHDPQVLVLDEASSSLDNRTEHEIMDDIYGLHGEKTIIMIAHRLDTIKRCDRILVFEYGQLVGEGTYDDLRMNNIVFQGISMQEGLN